MSEKPQNNDKNQRPAPGGMGPRLLIIWILIAGALLAIYSMQPAGGAAQVGGDKPWTINDVMQSIRDNKVEKGEVRGDSKVGLCRITLTLKEAAPAAAKPEEKKEGWLGFSKPTNVRICETLVSEQQVETLTAAGFVFKPATTIWSEIFQTLLVFGLVLGLLYFFFIRQMKSAGRGALSFGKSRAKMLTRESTQITFADVAGCDEAKEEVSEVVDFLKDPKKFTRIGARIPKGVLLVGPPGTGKTLLAKAVAGEADVPFFSISGSDFVEMFVGVGAARVRDLFEQGRKNAPCIIFIDEIDAVGRQRGIGIGGGNDEREQTLNSILVEMDGFDSHEGVIIMAATNRPDVLDSALLRPGRFDRQVNVDLPDIQGRLEILQVHARKIKLSPTLDLSQVARGTSGFSGADLANLLNEAALLAARHGNTEVSMQDVDEARDKIAYGRERRKLMDEEDKRIVAYHEAGHALVQVLIDDGRLPVHHVTIIPRGSSLGSTMFLPNKDLLNSSRSFILNRICCGMGGRVAEELAIGEITRGASGDIRHASALARSMVCEWGMSELGMVAYGERHENPYVGREFGSSRNYSDATALKIDQIVQGIIQKEYDRAMQLCRDHRPSLDAIAEALLKYETIDGVHVREILEKGAIESPVTAPRGLAKPKAGGPPPLNP